MRKIIYFLIFFLFITNSFSKNINSIEVKGNDRISKETIIVFGKINKESNIGPSEINKIIKNLYNTNFFKDIKIIKESDKLTITVIENPLVQTLKINGVKNKTILNVLNEQIQLKEKQSFQKNIVKLDENRISNILRSNGYFFAEVNSKIIENDNNTVDLIIDIELGEKAYIKKIKFIGDKKIKDRKLRNIIVSEEAKFWKFISNKKFLDAKRIKLDEKLLKNYYKNKGYFNVKINSSSAQIINEKDFELVFNINAGDKYFFNNLNLIIPSDFDKANFKSIIEVLNNKEGEIYSLNSVEKILDEIDKIVLQKEFEFINARYAENIVEANKINLNITLEETEKFYIERVNIYGNYITQENVVRNALITDEGDPFNKILFNKSVNNIKSKNIFASVKSKVKDGSTSNKKIIDLIVEEKPTGEISAGAGTGTSGSSVSFGIKENNYMGRGVKMDTNLTLSDTSITGRLSINNPNYKNTSKSLTTTFESSETDLMSKFGYKNNKTGFSFGTSFEQYKDLYFSPSISNYYESLTTSSKASDAKKKQQGSYFESLFSYGLTLNKLNRNYQPTDGYRSSFNQVLPLISNDGALVNSYEFSKFHELRDEMILAFNLYGKAINSLTGEDVRISKRIILPSKKLRGFEQGKIGPMDSGDYIGGNYASSMNISTTLPQLLSDFQNVDFKLFFDAANVWGVDYNRNFDSSKIRSSTGLAVDWFTPIGPLSFSFSEAITKADTDKTERFRFNIGTTF